MREVINDGVNRSRRYRVGIAALDRQLTVKPTDVFGATTIVNIYELARGIVIV